MMLSFNSISIRCIAASLAICTLGQAGLADSRCGFQRPAKQDAERITANIDTDAFLDHVDEKFRGKFTGYAVILTGSAGERLGFRREGWAIDPCDDTPATFTLDTENGIGSVTKLFTTVAVLKATSPGGQKLQTPFTEFLPRYWKKRADDFYDDVSIAMLLQHQGGFLHSGNKHISERLADNGPEIGTSEYNRKKRNYSNTGFGLFHFIYAKYGFLGTNFVSGESLPDIERDYVNNGVENNLPGYNQRVQRVTSAAYNYGLYRHILEPLEISATCDPRTARFPPEESIRVPPNARIRYFRYHTPSRSYASASDNQGALLPPQMQNCASGGLSMSAKDLSKFITALGDPDFLHPAHKARMINDGPADDLFGFDTWDINGDRAFYKDGAWSNVVSVVLVFPSGANAVFVGNTASSTRDIGRVLVNAYRSATGAG